MKASVNGVLTFGLVSVPVGVASAIKTTNDPSFRTLHVTCKQPVKIKTVANESKAVPQDPENGTGSSVVFCETCNTEATETLKGFEYAKGEFVYFTDIEMNTLKPERLPTIELKKFVKVTELKPVMIDKHYFLIPNKTLTDSYGLLYQSLAELKVAGIGTQSLWGKEHPCAVVANRDYPEGGVLMMQTLVPAEDLVDPDFAAPIPKASAKKLAKEVVTSMTQELSLDADLANESRSRIFAAISAKVEGREIPVEAQRALEEIPDLTDALRKSIAKKTEAPKSRSRTTAKKR